MKITKFFEKITDAVWYREKLRLKYGRENVSLVDYPLFWGEPGTYIFNIKTQKKMNYSKNFRASVPIVILEIAGWCFDYEPTMRAMDMAEDEAVEYQNHNYHVEIYVDEEGRTFWQFVNTRKKDQGIIESSDYEWTGDDDQTIKDIEIMHECGKLWDVKNESNEVL